MYYYFVREKQQNNLSIYLFIYRGTNADENRFGITRNSRIDRQTGRQTYRQNLQYSDIQEFFKSHEAQHAKIRLKIDSPYL